MAESDSNKRRAASLHDVDIVTVETYHRSEQAAQIVNSPQTSFPTKPQRAIPRLTRVDIFCAIGLAIAAFAGRWPLIERGETLLHPDEAVVGIMAQDIAAGRSLPIYFYGQRYMGALESYVVAGLTPLFDDPIHALRSAPCLFFAILVATQYLMLTRWFGRRGGLLGAAALIFGSPMFAQWSISSRGGYIEVLLWGTLLLWSYTEWFMRSTHHARARLHQFAFGLVLGSGFWINPSVLFFVLPIVAHTALSRLPFLERITPLLRIAMRRLRTSLAGTTLPMIAIFAVLAVNMLWTVWVDEGRVRSQLLLGLFPTPFAVGAIAIIIGATTWQLARRTNLIPAVRTIALRNAVMLLGAILGALPAVWYVVQHSLSGIEMEPALPLGFRPLWKTGETMIYLLCGLPLYFGADPRPFISHVTVGRDHALEPLDIFTSALVAVSDRLVLASIAVCCSVIAIAYRNEVRRLMTLRGVARSPVTLLLLGVAGTVTLYLLGGCSCSFTTIRYLLPLWAFIPGLLAAVAVNRRFQFAGKAAPVILCASWLAGQYTLCMTIGAPHPLHVVADSLVESRLPTATAEILDAHLLSYLTRQSCRVREYQPFWPRLAHYESDVTLQSASMTDYVVNTTDYDRTSDWTDPGTPGPPPPETQRSLWPTLKRTLQITPHLVQMRDALPSGYERIRLATPLD
ncbi:MAG: hypothetical protein AABZ08_12280 [Planctomycetota bacterium]